jgi:hypothetical protein
MICEPCKAAGQLAHLDGSYDKRELVRLHTQCKGETHCTCQHRLTRKLPNGTLADIGSDYESRLPG